MITSLLAFFGVLSILVLVHELGHFLAAKFLGVGVVEFGLGLPPRIWGKKVGGTVWSINLLPIGGFVKLIGEDDEEGVSAKDHDKAFFAKPKMVRILVVVAGVVMNFILAVGLFTYIYTKLGIPTKTNDVYVVGLAKGSPAEAVGIKEGDKLRRFKLKSGGEKDITSSEEFIGFNKDAKGQEIELFLERKEGDTTKTIAVKVTPRVNPPEGEGPLGVAISSVIQKFYPWYEMPFRASAYGFSEALGWAKLVLSEFAKLITNLVTTGQVSQEISGPVGIFQVTSQVAKTGIINLLQLMGILSVNLAVLNVLPIPALDGGRLAFILVEAVLGKRVVPKYEKIIHSVGLMLLIGVILLVTVRDIARIVFPGV